MDEFKQFLIIKAFVESESGKALIRSGGHVICNCGQRLDTEAKAEKHMKDAIEYHERAGQRESVEKHAAQRMPLV